MKRNHPLRQTPRFRYWTRKGYAAFASLGQCVTIGCLRKNVTERALTKQTEPSLAPYAQRTDADSEAKEAEAMALPDSERLLLLLIGAQAEATGKAAPGRDIYIYSINSGRDALNASCNSGKSLIKKGRVARRIRCVYTYITHQQ